MFAWISDVPPTAASGNDDERSQSVPSGMENLSGEAISNAKNRLVDVTAAARELDVMTGMAPVECEDGRKLLVNSVVVVFDGPRDMEGSYPLPESADDGTLVDWVGRHPQIPDRASLKRLLSVFGLQLPTTVEARAVFQSAAVQCPDLPVPLRDDISRVMMPDGRLVFPGDPAEVRANNGQLAVIGVRQPRS